VDSPSLSGHWNLIVNLEKREAGGSSCRIPGGFFIIMSGDWNTMEQLILAQVNIQFSSYFPFFFFFFCKVWSRDWEDLKDCDCWRRRHGLEWRKWSGFWISSIGSWIFEIFSQIFFQFSILFSFFLVLVMRSLWFFRFSWFSWFSLFASYIIY